MEEIQKLYEHGSPDDIANIETIKQDEPLWPEGSYEGDDGPLTPSTYCDLPRKDGWGLPVKLVIPVRGGIIPHQGWPEPDGMSKNMVLKGIYDVGRCKVNLFQGTNRKHISEGNIRATS